MEDSGFNIHSFVENGVLFVVVEEASIDNVDVVSNAIDQIKVIDEKRTPCIVDISSVKYISMPVMNMLTSSTFFKSFSSLAVVADNPVTNLLFSIFLKKSACDDKLNIKSFDTVDLAIKWTDVVNKVVLT